MGVRVGRGMTMTDGARGVKAVPGGGAVAGLVLAGGQGGRVAGADKGLLDVGGRPMAAFVVAALRSVCDRVVISANRNFDRYAALADGVVADSVGTATAAGAGDRPARTPGHGDGPLAGIHAGLGVIGESVVLVAPCDMPGLDRDVFALLLSHITSVPGLDAVSVFDGEREQPLVMALRSSVRAHLASYLAQGGRSVRGWLQRLRTATVEDARPTLYRNVNTATDLERVRRPE